jgi:hypothetical protein
VRVRSRRESAIAADEEADYLEGKMKVDEYVTHRRTLGEINDGFHDMHVCLLRLFAALAVR